MTYQQLLEAVKEAQELQALLDEHMGNMPVSHRLSRPSRTRVYPDPMTYEAWDNERQRLQALLNAEITF